MSGYGPPICQHLPHSTSGTLEETVKAVQDQQLRQEQQLERQRQSIAELKAQLEAALEELRPHHASVSMHSGIEETTKIVSTPEFQDDDIPEYQLEQSMWDALLLLFFRNVMPQDKVVLVIGFIMNLGLQTGLLLVLWLDMVDTNNYGSAKVQEMLNWRVLTGHADSNFDQVTGKSLIGKLCAQDLWSFEQSQYDEMVDYLYKPIPGAVLSALALVLWVLSSMVEYRRIVEQGLAILRLPTIHGHGLFQVMEAGEELEIVGARPFVRMSIVFFLLVPRFVVLGFLCVGGCKYLAETASLPDLVLNAMALAFILDVDELLCQVLLPHRLRTKLDNVKPMPCGRKGAKVFGFSKNDWFRYLVTVGLVVMAFFVYLDPFMNNVEGAATALCGGKMDFSYAGGVDAAPTVTLMNSSDYISVCSVSDKDAHMSKFYGIGANQTRHTASLASSSNVDWDARKKQAVLAYAFKGCDAGLLTNPVGNCGAVPTSLSALLPASVTPGANADPAVCPVLEVNKGSQACSPPASPVTCRWTWKDQRCEDDHLWPGTIYEGSCNADLATSCSTWRYELQRPHPTANCLIADMCGPPYDCVSSWGTLDFKVRNTTTFFGNETYAVEALRESLVEVINITTLDSSQVEVEYTYSTTIRGDTASDRSAYWIVRRLPSAFFPNMMGPANATLVRLTNDRIVSALGSDIGETYAEVLIGDGTYFFDVRYHEVMQVLSGTVGIVGGGTIGSGTPVDPSPGNVPALSPGSAPGTSPAPSGSSTGAPTPLPTGGGGTGPAGTPSPAPGGSPGGPPPTRLPPTPGSSAGAPAAPSAAPVWYPAPSPAACFVLAVAVARQLGRAHPARPQRFGHTSPMADAEDVPPEWGWPKQPYLPEDLKHHVLQETQATQQELWNEALEARAIDSKLEDHMAEKVFANVLLNKEGTGEEKTGKVYEGIDPNAYKKGKWYRFLNYKGDCYVYVHNYTKDITATRPENFTDLTDEEKKRIAKLGIYIKSLPEEVKRIYDNEKVVPIIYGTADTCDALKTFFVYDKHHQLLDATKLAKRITSGALEDCRKAIVAATSLGKTLCIYCGDDFPDFAEKVCAPKNKDTFPLAVFTHGGMENDMVRERVFREEDKEAGQCPVRPGYRVCILVQYDSMGFEMSSMRKTGELPQKIPNFQQLKEVRCYSDADETKVLELMRSGKTV